MSTKYHRKKSSTSNYPERLKARGLSRAPIMPSLDYLRNKQLDNGKLKREYIAFETQLNQAPIRTNRNAGREY